MIGWYAHHQGRGHLQRAASVLEALAAPATVLTSADVPDGLLPDQVGLVALPRDDDASAPGLHGGPVFVDPTAGGILHWAPLGHPGYVARMARIAAWAHEADARALVVDTSVEVATLGRLLGLPVVVGAMPGHRVDAPHSLAHTLATALVAPWPDWVPHAPHLAAHADRVHRVGGISRFAGRERAGSADRVDDRLRVVVLGGAGGSATAPGYWAAVAAALPGADLTVLGGADGRWVDDPWPLLCGADLVVTHAGQNAVADVAAAGVPAIVVPEPRPFDEQRTTAEILGDAGLAAVVERLPSPDSWVDLLDSVLGSPAGDPRSARARWSRWQVDGAADRAAAVVAEVAS